MSSYDLIVVDGKLLASNNSMTKLIKMATPGLVTLFSGSKMEVYKHAHRYAKDLTSDYHDPAQAEQFRLLIQGGR